MGPLSSQIAICRPRGVWCGIHITIHQASPVFALSSTIIRHFLSVLLPPVLLTLLLTGEEDTNRFRIMVPVVLMEYLASITFFVQLGNMCCTMRVCVRRDLPQRCLFLPQCIFIMLPSPSTLLLDILYIDSLINFLNFYLDFDTLLRGYTLDSSMNYWTRKTEKLIWNSAAAAVKKKVELEWLERQLWKIQSHCEMVNLKCKPLCVCWLCS